MRSLLEKEKKGSGSESSSEKKEEKEGKVEGDIEIGGGLTAVVGTKVEESEGVGIEVKGGTGTEPKVKGGLFGPKEKKIKKVKRCELM